jgi:hypothetical protein
VSSQVCRALRITKVRARRGDHIGETVTRGCPSIPRCMEMFQGPSRSELQRLELNSKADGTESSFVQLLETLQPGNGMARALQQELLSAARAIPQRGGPNFAVPAPALTTSQPGS